MKLTKFEIRLVIESHAEIKEHTSLLENISKAIRDSHPELIQRSVDVAGVVEYSSNEELESRINGLSGRSKIIARFLYDNPGSHSTQELRDLIDTQQPFKNQPILHSYLNNLIGRGLVVKVAPGMYRSVRFK
jgi:hypothetical protein